MGKTTDSVIFSDAEQEILEIALQNPALSNSEIADQTGYRLALIRDTRRQYEDELISPTELLKLPPTAQHQQSISKPTSARPNR